jgi:hypothetical protein
MNQVTVCPHCEERPGTLKTMWGEMICSSCYPEYETMATRTEDLRERLEPILKAWAEEWHARGTNTEHLAGDTSFATDGWGRKFFDNLLAERNTMNIDPFNWSGVFDPETLIAAGAEVYDQMLLELNLTSIEGDWVPGHILINPATYPSFRLLSDDDFDIRIPIREPVQAQSYRVRLHPREGVTS